VQVDAHPVVAYIHSVQGCQIFHDTTYQNEKNIPNDHRLYHTAINYNK
jgi:hypothetical protein